MVLSAVAGELGERVGVVGGDGEIAGGEVHFRGHQQEVVELEPGRRVEWQRLEHLASTAQRLERVPEVGVSEVFAAETVEGDTLDEGGAGVAGANRGAVGGLDGVGREGTPALDGGRNRGVDWRRAASVGAGIIEPRLTFVLARDIGDDAGIRLGVDHHPGPGVGGGGVLSAGHRLAGGGVEQAEGVVPYEAGGGSPGGETEQADPVDPRGGEFGGLLVTALCLGRPAAKEQQLGQQLGQVTGNRVELVLDGLHDRGPGVSGDPIEALAPRFVALLSGEHAQLLAAPTSVPIKRSTNLAELGEPFGTELADRLECPVAGGLTGGDDQQAVVRQPGETIGDRRRGRRRVRRPRRRRRHRTKT